MNTLKCLGISFVINVVLAMIVRAIVPSFPTILMIAIWFVIMWLVCKFIDSRSR